VPPLPSLDRNARTPTASSR